MQITKLIALSTLALLGTAALADDPTPEPAPTASTLTRAEVRAEVQQARDRGELIPAGEATQQSLASEAHSTLTRAAVKAEVLQARARGELIPAGEALSARHSPRGQRFPTTATLAQARVPAVQ